MKNILFLTLSLFSQWSLAASLFGGSQTTYINANNDTNDYVQGIRDPNSNYHNYYRPDIDNLVRHTCDDLPESVKQALSEAQNFTKSCRYARLAPGKKIAINDYSGSAFPKMYIFDQSGNCEASMPITWGMGSDKSCELTSCNTNTSHSTPAGFHMTARHTNGSAYNESNSLLLAGLSGQISGNRGILIHPAHAPGTATSWGCTGVPYSEFQYVQQSLGFGSLVYNYFGDKNAQSKKCSDNTGAKKPPECKPEAEAVAAQRQEFKNAGIQLPTGYVNTNSHNSNSTTSNGSK